MQLRAARAVLMGLHTLRSHGRTALGPTGGTEIEVVAHEAFETQALHEATATIASVEDTSKATNSKISRSWLPSFCFSKIQSLGRHVRPFVQRNFSYHQHEINAR